MIRNQSATGLLLQGMKCWGARITDVQIIIVISALLLVIGVGLWFNKSRTGKAMRAVANDSELAKISGIDSDKIILAAYLLGSALAGVAGILVALDVGHDTNYGDERAYDGCSGNDCRRRWLYTGYCIRLAAACFCAEFRRVVHKLAMAGRDRVWDIAGIFVV